MTDLESSDTELRRGGWHLIRQQARASPGWAAFGITVSLLWVVVKITIPLMARSAIDAGVEGDNQDAVIAWAIGIAAVAVVAAFTASMRRYAAFALSLRAEADLRSRLFDHLQGLHFGYHDVANVGDLMARANLDLKQIQLLLVFIPVGGANVVMVVGICAVLFSIDAPTAFVAVAALPFLAIAARRFNDAIHPIASELQAGLSDVSRVVEESISGIRVVKGHGAEEVQMAKLAEGADRVYDQGMGLARLRAVFNPLLELLPTVGLIGVLWFGGHRVIDGYLSIGDLVAFNFYILLLIFPLRMTSFIVAQMSRAGASAARVYEVLGTDPQIVDSHNHVPMADGEGAVRFDDVDFSYGDSPRIIDGLDLYIPAGQSVALVGTTGSGKTTLARLIPRFYDVDSGSISIDGIDVRDLTLAELRRNVGMVFEDTFLFTDSVAANIAFANRDASHEEVVAAARLAGVDDFVSELPDGYDTVLGESGFSVSGGQRQRIAIARALLVNPRILILDDATSSVDPTKEHEIRDALDEVMLGRTTIIIAHRPATIALANRVLVLEGGRVVEEGTHATLLAESQRYRRILAQHSTGELDESAAVQP
ncbi:MAG: ABC transporter ATP-binding protein [Acidobacteria bacterium]|nr:ABC transporter ATP-binding protein [Acidobacteriota bacterium]